MAAQPIAPPAFDLEIPPPKMLTAKEELAMTRVAFAQDPGSKELLLRLSNFLVRLDFFDEAIALLDGLEHEDPRQLEVLHMALLGRETPADNLRALEAARRFAAVAGTPRMRARALACAAKAHARLGHIAEAKAALIEALALYPMEKDAYKRLFSLYMTEDPEVALAFAQDCVARGMVHSRSLGSVILALTKLGRFEEARRVEGFEEFLARKFPAPPRGWASLEALNEALTIEILNHPDIRYERYGTASARTWRVDEPALRRCRAFLQLQEMIRAEVLEYAARLSEDGHPWPSGRPEHASLRNWCVVTQGDGYETWHVHQNGWMSGVYYIHVQDHIANGTGPEGCIAFGLPEDIVGKEAAAAFGERVVRPQTGLLMMFPSHVFHRTYPHHGDGHRICLAFDIIPSRE